MPDRVCSDCVYYSAPESGSNCGTCDYPVPGWLRVRVAGGNFLSGYEAINCHLYKTKSDLAAAEIGKMKGEKHD